MSQVFNEDGKVVPVTLVKSGPCVITQVKTRDKDGYEAIQIGFGKIEKKNKIRKTMKGKEFEYLREFRVDNVSSFKKGDVIDVSIFKELDKITVSGDSKGKGFQGALKRWNFASRGRSHGVKHERRTIGSVGMAGIARVLKGKKMPGRMGKERISTKNLKIIKVDKENNILYIKGAVPGKRGALLEIRSRD